MCVLTSILPVHCLLLRAWPGVMWTQCMHMFHPYATRLVTLHRVGMASHLQHAGEYDPGHCDRCTMAPEHSGRRKTLVSL